MPHIDLPEGVPGIRGPMMARPDVAIHLNELASVLLHDAHSLSPGERELIATAVSRANKCTYCATVHGAIAAAHFDGDFSLVESVAVDHASAPISPKLSALIALALLVRESGSSVTDSAVNHARMLGATDLEIHDSLLIGASFSMFNRYVDGLDTYTPTDPDLYASIGRERAKAGYRAILWAVKSLVLFAIMSVSVLAGDGSITGTIRLSDSKEPARNVRVQDVAAKRTVYTNSKGVFVLKNLAAGKHTISIHGLEIADTTIVDIDVKDNESIQVDVEARRGEISNDEVVVYGASKRYEKITESPSAVTAMSETEIQRAARGGQLGRALEGLNGVDIVQNGATDFNVNVRGFNNSTNRRLLVLVDGRDVSLQQIGAVEWNSFASSLGDFRNIELVRGPAAALYGANAFNGVLNMTTLSPREAIGTKISLLAGDYKTLRGDVRHAGALGDLSYKVTIGHSQSYNLAQNRTDSASMVAEYPSLWPAARELNQITSEDRETFATYGTVRLDYDLSPTQVILGEFGYSQFGNEVMLAGSGRIHVPQSEKPFVRLAYNDTHLHLQSTYNARKTIDTMRILAAPPGTIILDDSYDLNLDAQYTGSISPMFNYAVGTQFQYLSIASNNTVFPDEPILARILGIYGQIDIKPTDNFSISASARVDQSNIYPTQFSPRVAMLFSPIDGQQFRVSAGRSFQRANFSELYRKYNFRPAFTTQGRPVNFRPVQAGINDTLSKLTGNAQNIDLRLFNPNITSQTDPRGIQPVAYGVGNLDLDVEENIGYEIGYNGNVSKRLTITVDAYYNRLTNFISGFLPGVNSNYATWSSASSLPDSLKQYSALVDSLVYQALTPQDRARFTTFGADPAFIVSNTNLGLVEQFGLEVSATFAITQYLRVTGNYAYYHANLLDAKTSNPFLATGSAILSPNTSPHRINIGASYEVPLSWDASVMVRYVDGFAWLAGDFQGTVPTYTIVNLNAGLFIFDELRVGVAVNNLFDFRHYEAYGGSNIPRLTYVSASYSF
ncbi:MAG: TonB-dependent receptor [Candidatus Kapabacteria bacterium]|nr:TonB-dependent receptor [Candidatus Kapabacteria bacterium]